MLVPGLDTTHPTCSAASPPSSCLLHMSAPARASHTHIGPARGIGHKGSMDFPFDSNAACRSALPFPGPCSAKRRASYVLLSTTPRRSFSLARPGLRKLGYFRFLSVGHLGFPVRLLHQRVTGVCRNLNEDGLSCVAVALFRIWSEKGLRHARHGGMHRLAGPLTRGRRDPHCRDPAWGSLAKPRHGGIRWPRLIAGLPSCRGLVCGRCGRFWGGWYISIPTRRWVPSIRRWGPGQKCLLFSSSRVPLPSSPSSVGVPTQATAVWIVTN